jgi:hypothetical protein
MAAIKSGFTVSFGGTRPDVPVMTGSAGAFVLGDNITLRVVFDDKRSWKRIAPLTLKGEQLLLDHEQGHYDITALMARDCFIDIMQLKAKTYGSEQDGRTEATDIVGDYRTKLEAIQKTYDNDTTHGAWVTPSFLPERKESFQTKWEGFIHIAKSEIRQPEVSSPFGKPYKVRLLEVLAKNGFTF